MLDVIPVRALRDNYIWLIRGPDNPARVAIVDPGEPEPVERALAEHALAPAAVLVTHHHPDHTGGVAALAARYAVPVFGPAGEAAGVVTHRLEDGERFALPDHGARFEVLHIPGHTLGHIAFSGHGALFCGDTLFSAGCGRLFEGTPEQMLASLERLAALPNATRVYCGHEYTAANLAFAAAVEPDNAAVTAYRSKVAGLLAAGEPTLPSTIELERAVNPFLRTAQGAVRRAAGQWSGKALNDKVRVFAALRRWKDEFRPG